MESFEAQDPYTVVGLVSAVARDARFIALILEIQKAGGPVQQLPLAIPPEGARALIRQLQAELPPH